MADVLTLQQYLSGKVRNIAIPDNTVATIIVDAGIESVENPNKDTDISLLSTKERELCLAWTYIWIAGSPTQSGGYTEENADWKQSENGERMSANVLKQYLAMANDIFRKYDLPVVGEEPWGFVGRGIRNPRRYR